MGVLNVVNIDQCGCAAGCCYVEVILPRVLLPGKRRVGVAGLWRRNNCLLLIFFVTVLWCNTGTGTLTSSLTTVVSIVSVAVCSASLPGLVALPVPVL